MAKRVPIDQRADSIKQELTSSLWGVTPGGVAFEKQSEKIEYTHQTKMLVKLLRQYMADRFPWCHHFNGGRQVVRIRREECCKGISLPSWTLYFQSHIKIKG